MARPQTLREWLDQEVAHYRAHWEANPSNFWLEGLYHGVESVAHHLQGQQAPCLDGYVSWPEDEDFAHCE